MNARLIIIACFTFFVLTSVNANNTPTVEKQLVQLNKYWTEFNVNEQILHQRLPLNTEVALISTHLQLVEQHLRKTTPEDLTAEQKKKRLNALDILKDYYKRGIFPINTYHDQRTPYFIDSYGTACAVGKLMIETGYEDVAKKIARENNYAYIEHMNYPELEAWAKKYGFQLKELKWIQPAYCNPSQECPGTISHVSCEVAKDGCIGTLPTPTIDSPPYSYRWYNFNAIDSTWASMNKEPCNLSAGRYKCQVMNNVGQTEDFFYKLKYKDTLRTTAVTTNDNGSCNGSIVINVNGGESPYSYLWHHNQDTTKAVDNLCEGTYVVDIIDNNGCYQVDTFTIDRTTGIAGKKKPQFSLYPNPAKDKLYVQMEQADISEGKVRIYHPDGRKVQEKTFTSPSIQFNTSSLPNGLYLLTIKGDQQSIRRKFVKNGAVKP